MARLTDRERNLIQEARRTSGWPAWEETDAIILAARQARAKTIARWIRQGLAPLAGAVAAARSVTGRSILPLRRDLLRRRTVNELYRLDDRILADIGIVREQIEPTAADLAQAALPPSKPRVGLVSRLGLWRRRRAAIRELEALDDRLLDDIGLRRPEIREAVQRAAAEALVAPAVEGAPNAALPAPRSWPPTRAGSPYGRAARQRPPPRPLQTIHLCKCAALQPRLSCAGRFLRCHRPNGSPIRPRGGCDRPFP